MRMIQELMDRPPAQMAIQGGGGGQPQPGYFMGQNPYGQKGSNYKAPTPHHPDADGFYGGRSREFGDAEMKVKDGQGNSSISATAKNSYEVCFLQLQLQECFQIIQKKDDNLRFKQADIENLHRTIRQYVLTQD